MTVTRRNVQNSFLLAVERE